MHQPQRSPAKPVFSRTRVAEDEGANYQGEQGAEYLIISGELIKSTVGLFPCGRAERSKSKLHIVDSEDYYRA